MFSISHVILALLAVLAIGFVVGWAVLDRRATRIGAGASRPSAGDVAIGAVTNFFDTLGVSSFASTTALLKLLRRVRDEDIPGTLNVGHALPTIVQALVFIAIVTVEPATLVGMIAAATAGAWFGGGLVARLPRRGTQLGMAAALLIAAALTVAGLLHWLPAGGEARGLHGATLAVAIIVSLVLGALMMLGVGLYAPCLILVSLLGMSPLVAFPIMMGSCAFLMPVGGARFIASGRYSLRSSLGLAFGGVPGVIVAVFVVKSLPVDALRWLIVAVATYATVSMLVSAHRGKPPGAVAA